MPSYEQLRQFNFHRVLNSDPVAGSLILLGDVPLTDSDERAVTIVRIHRTTELPTADAPRFLSGLLEKADIVEENDIYSWMRGWLVRSPDTPDLKIDIICPATDVHVRKYTKQEILMVQETPAMYSAIVKPYIHSLDPKRTEWVRNILNGTAESHKILHSSPSFVMLPDMKWDPTSSSLEKLYLVAIIRDSGLKSIRDLRGRDIPLLEEVKTAAETTAAKLGLRGKGSVRMFFHYQPSYYQLHVHIVNANYYGLMGMVVGQAHLLDDVINMLKLDGDIFAKLTLSYGLGEQHGLFKPLWEAQEFVSEPS